MLLHTIHVHYRQFRIVSPIIGRSLDFHIRATGRKVNRESHGVRNGREIGCRVTLALRSQHQLQIVVVQAGAFGHFKHLGQRFARRHKYRASVSYGTTVHLQSGTTLVGLIIHNQVEPRILVYCRVITQVKRHVGRFTRRHILDKSIFNRDFGHFDLQRLLTDDRTLLVIFRHLLVFVRTGSGTRTRAENESGKVQVLGVDVSGAHVCIFSAPFIINVYGKIVVSAIGQYEAHIYRGFFFVFGRITFRPGHTLVELNLEARAHGIEFHIGGKSPADHETERFAGVFHIGIPLAVFHRGTGLHGEVLYQLSVFDGFYFGPFIVSQTGYPGIHRLVQGMNGIRALNLFCREIDFIARPVEQRLALVRVIVVMFLEHLVAVTLGVIRVTDR